MEGLRAPPRGAPAALYPAAYRSDVGALPFCAGLPQNRIGLRFQLYAIADMAVEALMKVQPSPPPPPPPHLGSGVYCNAGQPLGEGPQGCIRTVWGLYQPVPVPIRGLSLSLSPRPHPHPSPSPSPSVSPSPSPPPPPPPGVIGAGMPFRTLYFVKDSP